jgi:hypothetical protein
MGQDLRPNKGLNTEIIVGALQVAKVEERMQGQTVPSKEWPWMVLGACMVITYVLSLRGNEGLPVDLGGIIGYAEKGNTDYAIVTSTLSLIPCARRTKSGIDVGWWVARLISKHQSAGCSDGPATTKFDGKVMMPKELDKQLVELLEGLYD